MAIRILMIASAAFAVAQIWSFQVMAQSTPAPRYCRDVTSTAPAAATPHTVTQEDYPLVSVTLKEEGTVSLDVVVKEDGSVGDVQVTKSSGFPRLDLAAVEMVQKRWVYKPVTVRGRAVTCRTQVNVVWRLNSDPPPVPVGSPLIALRMDLADYPEESRQSREQGTVVLMVVIAEDGSIPAANIVQSSGFARLDAASVALLKSKFHPVPAQLAGKPVKTFLGLVMIWSLDVSPPPTK